MIILSLKISESLYVASNLGRGRPRTR